MHGDPGLVHDAFSICVCHTLPDVKYVVDGDGYEKQLQRVVVDFVLNWEPTSETPVDLTNVDEVVEAVATYYGIQRITFDRWNSAPSIWPTVVVRVLARTGGEAVVSPEAPRK